MTEQLALPLTSPARTHNVYLDLPRSWVVFNDDDELPSGNVDPATDFNPVRVVANWHRSCVWSSNCEWFFIIRADDILLLRVSDEWGIRCKRRVSGFFEWFLQSGLNR
jgi:hypothetical protein